MQSKRRLPVRSNKRNLKLREAAVDCVPGRPSDYFHSYEAFIQAHPDLPIVVCSRVSGRKQARNGNIKSQEAFIVSEVERLGGEVVACVPENGVSGYVVDRFGEPIDRPN